MRVPSWTSVQKFQICEMYLKSGNYYQARLDFKEKNNCSVAPSVAAIKRWLQKLRNTGGLKRKKREVKSHVRIPEIIEKVKDLIERDNSNSLRKIAQQLLISRGSVRRILKEDLGLKCIKPRTVQESDSVQRKTMSDVQWRKLAVSRNELEIATVLACGQSFRWKNDGPDSEEWIGVFAHSIWILKQEEHCLLYKTIGKPGNSALTSDECEKALWKYFQLDISLPALYEKWSQLDSKFAELTITDYRGIRMLEQDPIENIFSFICSSNNNIIRISQMVEKMCRFYGDKIGDLYGKTYYDFPAVEKLRGMKVEVKLRQESFGYRAAFIANTAIKIVENGGPEWVESLKNLEYNEANKQLQTLPGIGRKVADCICLMSLGFPEAIPVDTHMHQLGKQYLPHLASIKSLTDKVYTEISDFFRTLYGEYSGWAHSVLFASTLRHLKTETTTGAKNGSKKRKSIKKIPSLDSVDKEEPAEVSRENNKMPKLSLATEDLSVPEDLSLVLTSTVSITKGKKTGTRQSGRRKQSWKH